MRIFKLKSFSRWAEKHDLTDAALKRAVEEIAAGSVEANLGSNLYKKRIATKGRGKSGSVRTILAYSAGNKTFYLYAFEKSERDNITDREKNVWQGLGNSFLRLDDKEDVRAFRFTRNKGKAGGAGGRLALLPGRGVSPQPLFPPAAAGGRRGKTGKLKSPGRTLLDLDNVCKSMLRFPYVLSNHLCSTDWRQRQNIATLGSGRKIPRETNRFWAALLL